MRNAAVLFVTAVLSMLAYGQKPQDVPKPPPTKELTVKDSVAQTYILNLAADLAVKKKQFEDKRLQAVTELDKTNKPLTDQITKLQDQVRENSAKATQAFQKDTATLGQQIQTDYNQLSGAKEIVKKENDFPSNADFDEDTKKWVVPVEAPKPAEKK